MARPELPARVLALQSRHTALPGNRAPRIVGRRDGVRVEVNGRWLTAFNSTDQLGLAQQFGVVNALQDAAARDGISAHGTFAGAGRHALHDALEREVADWLEVPRAVLFESRHAASFAVQQVLLCEEDDVCVQDSGNHRSLFDATRLAGARLRRYPHRDAEGAMHQLRHAPDAAAMVASEGVFAGNGELAPLRSLALLARLQSALLYVDDAHATGLLGEQGRGSVAAAGLGVADVPLRLIALDGALGSHGALVAGDDALLQHIAGGAGAQCDGTALPPALAAAALESLRLARRDDWRREKLAERVQQFRGHARRHGLVLGASETPIQAVLCDGQAQALAVAEALEQAGWSVDAAPSSAAVGSAHLRVLVSALHSQEQVDGLVEALAFARDRVAAGTVPVTALSA